jgi:hypothetical protein
MDDGVFQDHEGARKDVIGFVPRREARYQSYQRQNWLGTQQAIYVREQLRNEGNIRAVCESTEEKEHGLQSSAPPKQGRRNEARDLFLLDLDPLMHWIMRALGLMVSLHTMLFNIHYE